MFAWCPMCRYILTKFCPLLTQSTECDGDKQSRQQSTNATTTTSSTNNADFLPEIPNLSTFYTSGDVDLGTLSELTKSVQGKSPLDGDGGRSKRTCVRVREEISRLEEILGEGASPGEGKPARSDTEVPRIHVVMCSY